MATTYRIALNRPIRRLFDYRSQPGPAEGQPLQPGQRVRVPFGQQSAIGIVTEAGVTPPQGIDLKPVHSALENWPLIPEETLQLLTWAANYYQHPLGECLFLALPPALRRGQPAALETEQHVAATPGASPDDLPRNARRQRELLAWLTAQTTAVTPGEIRRAGYSTAQIKALEERGLIRNTDKPAPATTPLLPLTEAQQVAFQSLPQSSKEFSTTLLYGITGSGKTEVYLHYLEQQLEAHQQALVLVPEINLTPQTVGRFRRHFGDRVALWHSALNDSERLHAWLRVRQGEPVILIGTRSAVLLPFTRLGALIVDEEHDSSYKQGEGFRYSARDLAVYRGHLNRCPVILGSATPSLESIHNTESGKYRMVRLESRAGNARPPVIRLLDIRSRPLDGGLAPPTLENIRQTLDRGQQVLVFVNRRGYSPVLMCYDCSHLIECPHCDSRLTYHQRDRALRCHHCDYQRAVPTACPKCSSAELHPVGQGTERAEETLMSRFPEVPVIRVDRDSTQRKGSMDALIRQVQQGDPCILVGTQMLAKGHDFHQVTLVVVVNADGGLFSADFRAPEQMTQTLIQVAGRAGRGAHAGEVLIQTSHSDHPLLMTIAQGDYLAIAHRLLEERQPPGLPPHRSMAILRAESADMSDSIRFLENVKKLLAPDNLELWGPLPAALARKANRHRAQLILLTRDRSRLRQSLTRLCHALEQTPPGHRLRWQIDVDPTETG